MFKINIATTCWEKKSNNFQANMQIIHTISTKYKHQKQVCVQILYIPVYLVVEMYLESFSANESGGEELLLAISEPGAQGKHIMCRSL